MIAAQASAAPGQKRPPDPPADRGAPGHGRPSTDVVSEAGPRLEDLLRHLAPQVLGRVARATGDFAAAEDSTQEALLAAATSWPADGQPDNPVGWLVRVAQRRMADPVPGPRRPAAAGRPGGVVVDDPGACAGLRS